MGGQGLGKREEKVMFRNPRSLFMLAGVVLFSGEAFADCDLDISDYVGWTIVYSGTVTGYIDPDGSQGDDFQGCEYDRILEIDHTNAVRCTEYHYSYAYYPDIVILTRQSRAIALH
jgi:hypothetical protein